jgi:phosphoglucomutase / phosphopentomutase
MEAAANFWITHDPNPHTRSAIDSMRNDEAALNILLGPRLAFGTAGLRGPMGPGTSRMNDLTVIQATQGLCLHLENTLGTEQAHSRGVIIGYDHRALSSMSLSSSTFAKYAARVLEQRGFRVVLLDGIVATPIVAYGVRANNHAAGIMVTASHNPKQDNGYKVYWGNGAQIVPPHDKGIADGINNALVPWHKYDPEKASVWEGSNSLYNAYFEAIKSKLCRRSQLKLGPPGTSHVGIVFTAMHGVGHSWCERAFQSFDLPPYHGVQQQIHPDPTFPTVEFPNPEEGAGALQLSFEEAARHSNAKVVLANDPDADRLAVAELQPNGEWRVFKGNEIGTLLASWELKWHKESNGGAVDPKAIMLASTVSSKMLGAMGAKEGFQFEDTLTGFKWMGTRASVLEEEDQRLHRSPEESYKMLFAYEEAIGFCIGNIVRDKDGVSAAAVFAEMSHHLYKKRKDGGSTVEDEKETASKRTKYELGPIAAELLRLNETYGFFCQSNGHFYYKTLDVVDSIFARLRNNGEYWTECGGGENNNDDLTLKIKHIRDLTGDGFDSSREDKKPTLPTSSAHMLTYTFETFNAVVTLRTSGTEPKLKYYVEVVGETQELSEQRASQVAASVVKYMLEPKKNGLTRKPQ